MDRYKLFIQDLVAIMKEKLEQSKVNQSISNGDFNRGISMGLYESLDLVRQQAEIFEIPLRELTLEDYPLEDFI